MSKLRRDENRHTEEENNFLNKWESVFYTQTSGQESERETTKHAIREADEKRQRNDSLTRESEKQKTGDERQRVWFAI